MAVGGDTRWCQVVLNSVAPPAPVKFVGSMFGPRFVSQNDDVFRHACQKVFWRHEA